MSLARALNDLSDGPARARPKKADRIAADIKSRIALGTLSAGHRLPQEPELAKQFGVSKFTIREALKSLEVQGLVRLRSGPGGGAFITRVDAQSALQPLADFFLSRDVSIQQIYAVRKVLEPQLAEAVVGHLDKSHFAALETSVGFCSCLPLGVETRRLQRLAELDFHDILADACPNPVLALICRLLNNLLKNHSVCQQIYVEPTDELARLAQVRHAGLAAAYRLGDHARVRRLMEGHMIEAERIMIRHAANIERDRDKAADLTGS